MSTVGHRDPANTLGINTLDSAKTDPRDPCELKIQQLRRNYGLWGWPAGRQLPFLEQEQELFESRLPVIGNGA